MIRTTRTVTLVSLFLAACGSALVRNASVPPHLRPEVSSTPGAIDVVVTGIPSVEGQLFVELYDEASYFHYDKVLNERVVPVTGRSMTVTLEHVPRGRYMVAVSQDANANNKLDTGWFGIPKEAYGFSRGARGTFGPPSFADGAVDFDGTRAAFAVAIR